MKRLSVKPIIPKLVITKFKGKYADWPRLWGQYSETIDKSSVPPVTKFTHLRELLYDRVRKTIEALPHTAEGYNRAVATLTEQFGKEGEIVRDFVEEITRLRQTLKESMNSSRNSPTAYNPSKHSNILEK